jgi:hypothetical protein
LVARDARGGKRDRDAADDHRNLYEVKFGGAARASSDEISEASLPKHWPIGKTDRNTGEENESLCGVGEAEILWGQFVEAVPGNVIDQDDDQRAATPKVDLRNTLSLYISPSLGHYHGPYSSSPQNGQPLGQS